MDYQVINGIKSVVIRENFMYFVPSLYNVLLKLNLSTWQVEELCDVNFALRKGLVDVICNDDTIWCVAMNGIQIAKYNLKNRCCEWFKMEGENRNNIAVKCYKEKIWIISRELEDDIICFDIKTGQFYKYDQFSKWCTTNKIRGKIVSFCIEENRIMMITSLWTGIVSFSFDTEKAYKYEIKVEDELFGIRKYKEMYSITSKSQNRVFLWDERNGVIKEYMVPEIQGDFYKLALQVCEDIIASRTYAVEILVNDRIVPINIETMKNIYDVGSLYYSVAETEEKVFLPPWNSNMFLVVDKFTGEIEGKQLELPMNKVILHQRCISEKELSLRDFIKSTERVKPVNARNNSGPLIYNVMTEDKGDDDSRAKVLLV